MFCPTFLSASVVAESQPFDAAGKALALFGDLQEFVPHPGDARRPGQLPKGLGLRAPMLGASREPCIVIGEDWVRGRTHHLLKTDISYATVPRNSDDIFVINRSRCRVRLAIAPARLRFPKPALDLHLAASVPLSAREELEPCRHLTNHPGPPRRGPSRLR